MAEDKITAAETANEGTKKSENIVELAKPYVFEGKEYGEIDLTGLEKLTVQDAIDGMPIEFFKLMPRGAFKRVAGAVRRHLNVESRTENHVMHLEQPRHYKGKEYRDIDLNGVADLNTLNESEAENRMAREGFVVTENSTNYLYSCVIAAMATGIPEEFFTTLPLYELLKLKNAVNDADFFG